VNYDTNNLYLAPYDWRLSLYNLEERDGYYSKLKYTIEGLKFVRIFLNYYHLPLRPHIESDTRKRLSSLLILWVVQYVPSLHMPKHL
jgi:hypothetical protein